MTICLHPPAWRCRLLMAVLLLACLGQVVRGQDVRMRSQPHLAIKVQAYQPLAWLAAKVHPDLKPPFMPGFWTGALEWSYSERHAVQLEVGIRRNLYYMEGCWNFPISGFRAGQRISLAWRDYFLARHFRPLSGPYYTPFVRYTRAVHAWRYLFTKELVNTTEVRAWTAGAGVGWQQAIGRHLRLDLGFGGELGYQWYPLYDDGRLEQVTSMDHARITLWEAEGAELPRRVGFGWTATLGVGWVIF
jgi:hypothetical protein